MHFARLANTLLKDEESVRDNLFSSPGCTFRNAIGESVFLFHFRVWPGVLTCYASVFQHPPPRLASRCPIWSDMTSVDTITQWREDWSSASVVSHTNVTDPTIRQPGFDVTRHTWSPMNRFRRGQGSWHANLRKWGLAQSPSCDCGQRQTMNHRRRLPWVSGGDCPRRKTHRASRCEV